MSQTPDRAGSAREVGFYEIRLQGHLDPRWATRLEVSSISHENDGCTALRVAVVDQAALHGLLHKIRDLGVPLISVARVDPDQPATSVTDIPITHFQEGDTND
jgi:hypothetical protein